MADPAIKAQLESRFLTTERPAPARARLASCLASDAAHILPDTSGEHVSAIQVALDDIRVNLDKTLPRITDRPGFYGPSTVAAVREYKRRHTIQRSGQPLDPVCGRMTISAIDNDLMTIEGTPPKPPPPNPPPVGVADIVVQILGFGGTNSPVQGQEQGDGVLRAAVASPAYLAKSGRSLTALVFTGGQQPSPNATLVRKIREALLVANRSAGKICLIGGSAGGKNVLALAAELVAPPLNLRLDYVGVSDGAFFDNDTLAPPNLGGTNLTIRSALFTAGAMVNVFQSAGNDTAFSRTQLRRIWQGKMPNGEVHGPISGFPTNTDVQKTVQGSNISFEVVHANAVQDGDLLHLKAIRELLDGA